MNPNIEFHIPQSTLTEIKQYVKHGTPTGGFLRAVLSNDLQESIGRADNNNLLALPAICCYLYMEVPRECWGTPAKVDAWLLKHRQAAPDYPNTAEVEEAMDRR